MVLKGNIFQLPSDMDPTKSNFAVYGEQQDMKINSQNLMGYLIMGRMMDYFTWQEQRQQIIFKNLLGLKNQMLDDFIFLYINKGINIMLNFERNYNKGFLLNNMVLVLIVIDVVLVIGFVSYFLYLMHVVH